MPNLDKTGPRGQGPKTGRRLGSCFGLERNCFNCYGRGLGFRRFFSNKDHLSILDEQEERLTKELNAIRQEKASLIESHK